MISKKHSLRTRRLWRYLRLQLLGKVPVKAAPFFQLIFIEEDIHSGAFQSFEEMAGEVKARVFTTEAQENLNTSFDKKKKKKP
ncbi:hypothetical protein V6N13_067785 [Hibiscus sabdariffa]